jgi:uncharacterized protein
MAGNRKLAGSVLSLWRYPVKSMQGEALDRVTLTERGLLGDRTYAILDRETGHIASAKHPRKWNRLLACQAAFAEPPQPNAPLPPIWITLPDGSRISSVQPDVDRQLSQALAHDVALVTTLEHALTREADRSPIDSPAEQRLIRAEPLALASPPGTFFDYAPVHLLTSATLARLQSLFPQGRFAPRRFRPNIMIAPTGAAEGFVENEWLGRCLHIGEHVRLNLIDPAPRCVVTTLAQGDLLHDPGILRTISQHSSAASVTLAPGVVFPAVAGAYAAVEHGGTIQRNAVVVLDQRDEA